MKLIVKSIDRISKSNGSYGNYVVFTTCQATYANGYTREVNHTFYFWRKDEIDVTVGKEVTR